MHVLYIMHTHILTNLPHIEIIHYFKCQIKQSKYVQWPTSWWQEIFKKSCFEIITFRSDTKQRNIVFPFTFNFITDTLQNRNMLFLQNSGLFLQGYNCTWINVCIGKVTFGQCIQSNYIKKVDIQSGPLGIYKWAAFQKYNSDHLY